jgi:uncharacterized protein YprB with RNaseH-like and TPR domain
MSQSTLSSKLKSLGVKVGARDVQSPPALAEKRRPRFGIENVVPGRVIENTHGACYVVETNYAPNYLHGRAPLHAHTPLTAIARWARDARIAHCGRESLVFLDTETTGLAGGSGTLPFMIGVGRFSGDQFRVAQFFMRGPEDEPALLAALGEWVTPCETLVTFNGRVFDVPLVSTRYTLNHRRMPLAGAPHLDLLPLARRLWRDRLASRALGSLEQHILGATRKNDDVPGFLIPTMYFDYLRSGDARPLRGIFYHNAMDILAMGALLGCMAQMLDDPTGAAIQHPQDYVSLGKLYEDLGEYEIALQAYERGREADLPPGAYRDTTQRLALLHRKRGAFDRTLELWREAARGGDLDALVGLAKHFEHGTRDYAQAERTTLEAISVIKAGGLGSRERRQQLGELEHRLKRVRDKCSRADRNSV